MPTNQQLIEPGHVSNPIILELRKEKSRDAARSRRGKENYEFYELAKMLPLPAAITSQLDKASIIRLTISYLKLRDFSGNGDPPWTRENSHSHKVLKGASSRRTAAGLALDLFEQHQGTHILQSLDGFALALAGDGRFLYISETVSIYLGLSQVEMTGSSIFDYCHAGDHEEIAEQLGLSLTGPSGLTSPSSAVGSDEGTGSQVAATMTLNSTSAYKGYDRAFCVRMKSTLTKRGCHFKSSGYRVVLILCHLRPQYTFSHSRKPNPPLLGMVGLAIALPPPSVHEIRLESDMFVLRINFDFTIAHCEPKISEVIDYTPEELTGQNLYTLCHGEDAAKLRKSHLDLINKGQVLTHYWRLMNKNGGYVWVQTCATVVCNSKNADEQNIICVNYVISNRECANLILDCCQMENGLEKVKREEIVKDPNNGAGSPGNGMGSNGDASPPDNGSSTGPPGPASHRHTDSQKSPKSGTPEPRSHRGRHATPISSSGEKPSLSDTSAVTPTVTPVSTSRRGQKRKNRGGEEPSGEVVESVPQMHPHEHVESTESSVKDLENAMSKHLPSPVHTVTPSAAATDFSTDALLKQQQHQQQHLHPDSQQHPDKNSTIQWIGHHNHHFHQQPAPMPATALLRQLYANRESVIRATARPAPGGVFYSTDASQNGPLPTPPGSESSFDNQFLLHSAHQQGKGADAFSNLVTNYSGYPMDYHNAMTPPSSVSPRDSNGTKQSASGVHGASHQGATSFDYTESLRSQYATLAGDQTTPSLPLKPQPYSAAAMHHVDAYGGLDQSQYFPHHSGFHLYHKGSPSAAGWYSTPS